MKTKIIGIALAAIMLASVFGALVPTGIAGTGDKNLIAVGSSNTVIIGQILEFQGTDLNKNIVGRAPDTVEGVVVGTATDNFDSALFTQTGTYFVDTDSSGEYDAGETLLSVAQLTFELKLVKPGTTDVISSTTEGKEVGILLTTNLPAAAQADIKLVRVDDGITLKADGAGDGLENLEVSAIKDFTIDTTDFALGDYDVYIKTDKAEADGLAASSNTVTFTLFKEDITITADPEAPTIGEDVKFTVQGPPNTEFDILSDKPEISVMLEGLEKVPDEDWSWDGDTFYMAGKTPFETNENGAFSFVMEFSDDKTVTITVENTGLDIDDDIDIDVASKDVNLEVPGTVIIGEKIKIKGTSNFGNDVDIFIEDEIVADDVDIDDGEFSKDIKTGPDQDFSFLKITGTAKIEVIVDRDADGALGSAEDTDDSAVVRLISGALTAEQADDILTTEGEDYGLSGTATGIGEVDVIIFGSKGGSQILTGGGAGFEAVDVEDDDTFEDDELVTIDDDTDTGTYYTLVLGPGRDGLYGTSDLKAGELEDGNIVLGWDFSGKDAEQILEILESDLWGAAGSDDDYVVLTFQVENAWLELDPIEAVGVGEPIEVSGSTNRADGTSILITVEGPAALVGAVVDVEDGEFSASIDTEDAIEGTYTIEADDGDGNSDFETVTIGAAAPATPTPAPATPTPAPATPVPTPVPTPAPATPTPAPATPTPEEPGFGAVFAIAGLLAVAYLVLRIKK